MLAEQAKIVDASHPAVVDPNLIEHGRSSTSLLLAFAAPWIGLVRPTKAGCLFANTSAPVFGSVLLLYVVATIALTLLVLAWHDSVTVEFISTAEVQPQSISESLVHPVLKERPIVEVLRSWHEPDQIDTIDAIILLVSGIAVVLTLFLAWLRFADHHEGGSAWRSFFRCWKCIFALTGFVLLVEALLWVPITFLDHLNARMTVREIMVIPWLRSLAQSLLNTPFAIAVNMVAVLWIFYASGRAVRGGRKVINPSQIPPMCEGCGYDLSHQDPETRCPECGRDVHASISIGVARKPAAWEIQSPSAQVFLKTSYSVLTSTTSTYSSMEVRSSETQAERFRGIHYYLISLGAAVWGFLCILFSSRRGPAGVGPIQEEELVEASIGAMIVFLLASIIPWITQRVLAAMAYTWWLIRRSLPDPRSSRKVLAYETAYLWLFCGFNGVVISTFVLFGAWLNDLFGSSFTYALLGANIEFAVMFAGNLILCLCWLYRYFLAMKAIRWANF